MALHELIIERANGTREQRFTDIPVEVGQQIRIGTDLIAIVARAEPSSRFAVDAFICIHKPRSIGRPSDDLNTGLNRV